MGEEKWFQRGIDLKPALIEKINRRKAGLDFVFRSQWGVLNELVPGYFGGDLVVIAARPSMGKTAFAINLALYGAMKGPVFIYSLEMSNDQILGRVLAGLHGLDSTILRDFTQCRDTDVDLMLSDEHDTLLSNLYICDRAAISSQDLITKSKELEEAVGHPVMIIVDYLQLMSEGTGDSELREREVAECSRAAKATAKLCDTPVFLLSQLNRGVEQRANKRPHLSDLRESGAIEQDADVVMFLYREDYYYPNNAVEGLTEIIVRKQRNGATGACHLIFDKERLIFEEEGKE